MNDAVSGVVLLVGLLLFAAAYLWLKSQRDQTDEAWLPQEVAGGELAFAERRFESRRHGLVARLDRAYLAGGELHLVELKTRGYYAAHASDAIELSVQRIVVEEATGERVSSVAYVAVQQHGQGQPRAIRVDLFDENEVLAMRRRLLELRRGQGQAPAPASRRRACDKCGHRAACQNTFGDRQ
jgi:CRISPR/Cas system-associated exonuclease Cas4 (RecB family)